MLVSELKAKVIQRGKYYNHWYVVYKFKGAIIVLHTLDGKIDFKLSEIERIEA